MVYSIREYHHRGRYSLYMLNLLCVTFFGLITEPIVVVLKLGVAMVAGIVVTNQKQLTATEATLIEGIILVILSLA